MKKNFFTLIALSSIIIFSSCQKDKQPDANTNLNKVKTYTENITSPGGGTIAATFNVGYDGNNRITSLTQTNASGIKFLFTYTSDTKYSMDLYESGSISVHEDFFLIATLFLTVLFNTITHKIPQLKNIYTIQTASW